MATLEEYVSYLPPDLVNRFISREQDSVVVSGRIPDKDAGALLMPEAEAVMCTVPGETPVATLPLMVAIEVLPSDAQVKVIPLIGWLNWSYATAV